MEKVSSLNPLNTYKINPQENSNREIEFIFFVVCANQVNYITGT